MSPSSWKCQPRCYWVLNKDASWSSVVHKAFYLTRQQKTWTRTAVLGFATSYILGGEMMHRSLLNIHTVKVTIDGLKFHQVEDHLAWRLPKIHCLVWKPASTVHTVHWLPPMGNQNTKGYRGLLSSEAQWQKVVSSNQLAGHNLRTAIQHKFKTTFAKLMVLKSESKPFKLWFKFVLNSTPQIMDCIWKGYTHWFYCCLWSMDPPSKPIFLQFNIDMTNWDPS